MCELTLKWTDAVQAAAQRGESQREDLCDFWFEGAVNHSVKICARSGWKVRRITA